MHGHIPWSMEEFKQLDALEISMVWPYYAEALAEADKSPCCKGKAGAIVFRNDMVLGRGYNRPPLNMPVASCEKEEIPVPNFYGTCCLHAEDLALEDALINHGRQALVDSAIIFARKSIDGTELYAKEPSCYECSKKALDKGLSWFVLRHEHGMVAYNTFYYNELSRKNARPRQWDNDSAIWERKGRVWTHK